MQLCKGEKLEIQSVYSQKHDISLKISSNPVGRIEFYYSTPLGMLLIKSKKETLELRKKDKDKF